jgi:hypothetical protein
LLNDIWEAVEAFPDEFIVVLDLDSEGLAITREVVGYYVPRQVVSSASAEMIEPRPVVAVLHSHHHLGAFHSSVDEDGVDNAAISLVFSSRRGEREREREVVGKMAFSLPCGEVGLTRNVVLNGEGHMPDPEGMPAVTARRSGCPFAGHSAEVLPCGLRIRRNRLLEDIYERATRAERFLYIERAERAARAEHATRAERAARVEETERVGRVEETGRTGKDEDDDERRHRYWLWRW